MNNEAEGEKAIGELNNEEFLGKAISVSKQDQNQQQAVLAAAAATAAEVISTDVTKSALS